MPASIRMCSQLSCPRPPALGDLQTRQHAALTARSVVCDEQAKAEEVGAGESQCSLVTARKGTRARHQVVATCYSGRRPAGERDDYHLSKAGDEESRAGLPATITARRLSEVVQSLILLSITRSVQVLRPKRAVSTSGSSAKFEGSCISAATLTTVWSRGAAFVAHWTYSDVR